MIILLFSLLFQNPSPPLTARLLSVQKIWNAAPHNAFTDLIRFENRWYCVFREGEGHATGEGKLRVLVSKDGNKWESAALIAEPGHDLRDAKISITPDGRLMLNGGSADPLDHGPKGSFYSVVTFSKDGRTWSPLQRVTHQNPADNRYWLWRVLWHKGVAYGVAYMTTLDSPANPRRFNAFFCQSKDGVNYERLTEYWPGVTEVALGFDARNVVTLLARGSAEQPKAALLQAAPPYREWQRVELTAESGGDQVGGPALLNPLSLKLPKDTLLGAGRRFSDRPSKEQRTGLFALDLPRGRLIDLLLLPSGGDTSYPGLVWYRDRLWMSYYSSHEGKSAIYLAKIELKQ
jgi:hypothetical protein